MLSLHRLERKQNDYSNPFQIRIFLFLSLLIWNWNGKYVHILRSFLENHTRFQLDQNGQNEYPFSDQNGAKTLPDGAAHTHMAYIREYPPGNQTPKGDQCGSVWCKLKLTPKGDFCVVSVGAFFVNFFMHSNPKQYLNGQMYRLFILNTKICNLHPSLRETTSIPVTPLGSQPYFAA